MNRRNFLRLVGLAAPGALLLAPGTVWASGRHEAYSRLPGRFVRFGYDVAGGQDQTVVARLETSADGITFHRVTPADLRDFGKALGRAAAKKVDRLFLEAFRAGRLR